jgi:hypothetical protein
MARGGSWSKLSRKAKRIRSAGAWAAYQLPNGDEPLFYLDFKNGDYVADGEQIAVADIAHTSGGWAGNFNPADVDPGVGYVADNDNYTTNLSLIQGETAYNLCRQPFTYIVDWIPGATDDCTCGFRYRDSVNEENRLRLVMSGPNGFDVAAVYMNGAYSGLNSLDNDVFTDTELYRVAYSVAADHVAYSVNGGPVQRAEIVPENETDLVDELNASDLVVFFISGTGTVLERLGFYPLQDDADLPSLSAL